jgi:GAF domain-containing protein
MNKTADQIELKRLRTLQNLDILDTESETSLDNISKLASHICECPVSLISLLDDKRQWFKSKVGLSVSETPRDISFCTHAIQQDDLFIIENAQADERFRLNPLVTADPSIRFYAGAPLFINGVDKIGTLCVIDRQPRTLSEAQKECLKMLAAQAVEIIEKRSLLRQQINFQKNLLNLFDESSTIMAVMKGPEHHFEYTNSAHTQNFNSLDAEAFRQPEMKKILDDVYLLGKTISLKDKAFIVDGSERYFNSIFTPSFSVDGTVDGVMSIMNDKT